jgi:hypothetical protein
MPREAWSRALVLLLAVLLTVPAGAATLPPDPQPTDPPTTSTQAQAPSLDQPLHQLAHTPTQTHTISQAHDAGQTWTENQLDDPTPLTTALDGLYQALDQHPTPHPDPGSVPAPFQAPIATLLTLQTHHAAGSGPYAHLDTTAAHAFTLGALEPLLTLLDNLRHQAPQEPILVDPLGLIVLGGTDDQTYTPNDIGPTTWQGPILLLEPAGNDTYHTPIAAPTELDHATIPITDFHILTLALELGGNDTYNDRTAGTNRYVPTILVDRHGHDHYATTQTSETTAHAGPGFAYLLDEDGNDTYQANQHGIANAQRSGTAILWDQQGHDTYIAGPNAVFTHAAAESRQAAALLWDEQGQDHYDAHLRAFGTAWNDAYARLLDEGGQDTYKIQDPDLSFGSHFEEPSPFIGDRITGYGLGEFIDAHGHDTYTWHPYYDDDYPIPANNENHTITWNDHRYGVFIDCTTPATADRPCPEEQHEARCTMLADPLSPRSEAAFLVDAITEPIGQTCRDVDV